MEVKKVSELVNEAKEYVPNPIIPTEYSLYRVSASREGYKHSFNILLNEKEKNDKNTMLEIENQFFKLPGRGKMEIELEWVGSARKLTKSKIK